jgi:hypothetical protein
MTSSPAGIFLHLSILSTFSLFVHFDVLTPFLEFGILPHPAKTNNPADLISEPEQHGGLQGAGANAYNTPGPHIPDSKTAEGLEKPKTRDEVSGYAVSAGARPGCVQGLRLTRLPAPGGGGEAQ